MKTFLRLIIFLAFLSSISTAEAVSIYVGTPNDSVQFMIIDYNGKRTGYDPTIKAIRNETGLPFMTYYEWDPANPSLAEEPSELQYMLQGEFPIDLQPLNIKLVVTGMKLAYTNNIALQFREDKSSLSYPQNAKTLVIRPLLDVNQVATYDIAYIPLQSLVATKVATSNDLIADMTSARKLGYIGNQKFVNELIKEVQEIEKERTEIQKPDEKNRSQGDKEKEHLTPAQKAIKEYKELLKELTEKYQRPEGNEFVKQEAYTVLREDLDYIIANIQ